MLLLAKTVPFECPDFTSMTASDIFVVMNVIRMIGRKSRQILFHDSLKVVKGQAPILALLSILGILLVLKGTLKSSQTLDSHFQSVYFLLQMLLSSLVRAFNCL